MTQVPLITVVTPVLNGARFIGRAIESVRRVSALGVRVEHLILDGGSTDGTAEIARRASSEPCSPIVRVVTEPDGGQSQAINRGLAMARGAFFAWLNADDYYVPEGLAEHARVMERGGAEAVVGRCRFVDERGRSVFVPSPPEPVETGALLRLLSGWFAGRSIVQPEAFVRTEVLRAMGGVSERLHYTMDYELWLRLCLRGARFELTGIDVARQLVHAGQKTRDNTAVVREMLSYAFAYLDRMREGPEREAAAEELALVRERLGRRDAVLGAIAGVCGEDGCDAALLGEGSGIPEDAYVAVRRIVRRPGAVVAVGLTGESEQIRRGLGLDRAPAIAQSLPGADQSFDVAFIGAGAVTGRGGMIETCRLARKGGAVVLVGAVLADAIRAGEGALSWGLGDALTQRPPGQADDAGLVRLCESMRSVARGMRGVSLRGCVVEAVIALPGARFAEPVDSRLVSDVLALLRPACVVCRVL